MMRKVIWCGTAVLACLTLAVTMAAYYVAENPDSSFLQATVAAYDVCSWFNPVLNMNRMAVPVACAKPCPDAEPWMSAPEGAPAQQWMHNPQIAPEPQEPPIPEVGELPQVAEPIVVEDITLPVIQETQEPAIETGAQAPFMNPSNETGMDDVPAFMPYADDDEAVLHQAKMDKPDFMTQLIGCFMNPTCPCDAEELGCCAFAEAVADFLKELCGEDDNTTEVPAAPDEPIPSYPKEADISTENTTEQPMPQTETANGASGAAIGSAVGAQAVSDPLLENPGVGAAATGVGGAIGETQSGSANPVGGENPATGTQDEYPPNSQNTNLQEDPNYHHQYPSCPYTGQCPYTGHCPYPYYYNVPSVPYTEPATQPVNVTKPKPKKPAKPKNPAKPVQKIDPMIDMETFGVDTMECRPTDVSGYLPGAGPF